jgi:polyphenol oxidase
MLEKFWKIGLEKEAGREMRKKNRLCYFPGGINSGCRYMLFDRHHGASEGMFSSLNISYGVGDSTESIAANRRQVKKKLEVSILVSARQIHGDRICVLTAPPAEDVEIDACDALITNQKNTALVIQHADCQAVLLYDSRLDIIAAVHSGWRGSVANLLGKTVKRMENEFGTGPTNLRAVISPSLGPCCSEFVNHHLELPVAFRKFMVRENYFDFWQISLEQLQECGVPSESVLLPTICTSCAPDYFSYRRACRESGGITGRNCSAIALFDRNLPGGID